VHVTGARDGSGRLFVVERRGVIRVLRGTQIDPKPFLNIRSRVLSTGGEQGLLSVAFPPGFSTKRHFYVDYTAAGGGPAGHTVVSRFGLLADGNADPASEEILLTVDQPFPNHNGGQLAFGPDGYLYIGMGDGGSGGDPGDRAQNLQSRLGKILRIDAEASVPGRLAIPPDNPFVGIAGDDAVWAYGLRNPWRFSFDRATGDLYIADVGQGSWEEVNFQPAGTRGGRNYGWNRMEGRHTFPPGAPPPPFATVRPVAEYPHGTADSNGCSITGGFVSRGARFPALRGWYFFGDYCLGKIWALRRIGGKWVSALVADTPYQITSFGEDDAGNLYLTDYAAGSVFLVRGQ
jgi:glucose/arabinose dehydrogenase